MAYKGGMSKKDMDDKKMGKKGMDKKKMMAESMTNKSKKSGSMKKKQQHYRLVGYVTCQTCKKFPIKQR